MFDIGFWELAMIFLLALLVLGPERLPETARMVGQWVGKARQVMASFQSDVTQEWQKAEQQFDPSGQLRQVQGQLRDVQSQLQTQVKDSTSGIASQLAATTENADANSDQSSDK